MENNQKIYVRLQNIYGKTKAYPVCINAIYFSDIAGTKTLTRKILNKIASLGYDIHTEGQCRNITYKYPDSKDMAMEEGITD